MATVEIVLRQSLIIFPSQIHNQPLDENDTLQSHHLFVGENRAVVHQRQAVCGVAVPTHRGFGNTAPVHLDARAEGANLAAEKRFLHLWDELGRADHHAADGDQLIDV